MKQLGKLEKVNPREIWPDEARDFTPWLRENIQALSEALGLDLEITEWASRFLGKNCPRRGE